MARARALSRATVALALLALLGAAALGGAAWAVPSGVRRREAAAGLVGTVIATAADSTKASEGSSFEPSGVLRAGSSLASVFLKPFYAVEAVLQAGSYDKAAVRGRIEREVKSSPVVVYSYELSPFCSQTKELLTSLGARYDVIELAPEWLPGMMSQEAAAVRAELGALTGQTSMPHVFIGSKSIGGLFTGTPGLVPLLEAGELQEQLKAAGAL